MTTTSIECADKEPLRVPDTVLEKARAAIEILQIGEKLSQWEQRIYDSLARHPLIIGPQGHEFQAIAAALPVTGLFVHALPDTIALEQAKAWASQTFPEVKPDPALAALLLVYLVEHALEPGERPIEEQEAVWKPIHTRLVNSLREPDIQFEQMKGPEAQRDQIIKRL